MKIKIKQILLFSLFWMHVFPFAGIAQTFSEEKIPTIVNDNTEIRSDCMADFLYVYFPDSSLTVLFVNNSFPEQSTWFWDFGDGNTSTEMNPEHAYENPGNYTVCLSIEDSLTGCSDMNCQEIFVFPAEDCLAAFDYFTEPSDPFTVYFYDLSFGNPETWSWEFGDGTVSQEINPIHVYNTPGTYDVCLTISSAANGCNDTFCSLVIVDSLSNCNAAFEYFEMEPGSVQFIDNSQGFHDNWLWDFGDGAQSTEQSPVHSYGESGLYEVCLTISDTSGFCDDSFCETIDVNLNQPGCYADFVYVVDTSNYFKINFFDNSMGEIIEWIWEFGDGDFSYEQNPVHTYAEEGIFTVCLTVSDGIDCVDVICYDVDISAQSNCQADFTYSISNENPFLVSFTDQSLGDIGFWFWDFGEGGVSSAQNPTYEYALEGTYNVCLVVTNNQGNCVSVFCDSVTVQNPDTCVANFSYQLLGDEFLTVQFTDLSEGDITQWSWDFGDGTTSDAQNPVHVYAQEGSYDVCLEIWNENGSCSSFYCDQLTLEIPDFCDADFTHEVLENEILTVQFTDLSQGIANQWLWDFGDGNISDLQNPLHVYADTGNYNVQLIIAHSDSLAYCSDSISKIISVEVQMPDCLANFTMHPDSGVNVPFLYHFHDASENNPEAWLWDFGDGQTSSEKNPTHQYEAGGSYEISLTVTKYNPWGEDCSDTKTIAMQTPAYFHIGGFVYAGNFPINNPEPTGDTAMVYLYRYHDKQNVVNIDTSVVVENGYFHALFLLEDNYMIKFRLTNGSANAGYYFPTYFGDEVRWLNAPVLSLADSSHYNVNVHLTEIPEHEPGIGMISGSVVHHSNADAQVPAGDSEILIYNSSDKPVAYIHSSDDGEFEFENLAFGTYTLYAESTGLFTDPVTVTISEANPTQLDVEIELFNTDITSVADPNNQTITHFRIFPNPVHDILNLSFSEKMDKELTYRIYDYSGREIMGTEIAGNFGSSENTKIDVSKLAKGIYFIHVYSMDREFSETLKFVR